MRIWELSKENTLFELLYLLYSTVVKPQGGKKKKNIFFDNLFSG